ncbi:Metallo-dependent phosphatase-like protein [Boletus reticuloceps]|uniref:Metallo-dependent phosphatase-like protein n=1 Tax=Boletus reticuloceps TaxID=495285 RepID=A0A8I2YKK1_9AGAM|nr:Metallo-dependent phosphatase-like protein [Boletus reticuloceps]
MDTSLYDELSFLHFNDVYHITQSTALGRLSHVFRNAKDVPEAERPITIFSGDAFSPSLESAVTKGKHMIPILNHLLVDVACYGNHEFDFGEDVLVNLSQGCTFPWLLANVVHADGRLMATAQEYLVLEKKGYRIGFFGLAGTDWPSNCQHLPVDCTILEPVSVAQQITGSLRSTQAVDIVIAITHMRHEEDIHLAKSCESIDLILGGHDHELAVHGVNVKAMDDTFEGKIKLIKSGTDFRSYSSIKMWVSRKHGEALLECIRGGLTAFTLENDLPDDSGMHDILAELHARMADAVDMPLFHSAVPLDGRTSVVRTEETNVGNMLADAVRAYYNTDIAFINSGSLRCDRVIDAGVITVKDMIGAYHYILPFDNQFVVKRLRGRAIAEALENAACVIIDGRFFQVSGIAFNIDTQAPVGSRVHRVYLAPGHTCGAPTSSASKFPLDGDGEYTVSMVAFIAKGFDGYTLFKDVPTLIDEEGAMRDSSLLLQVFRRKTHDIYERESAASIDRARAAIILGGTPDGLPFVSPSVQGRIRYTR